MSSTVVTRGQQPVSLSIVHRYVFSFDLNKKSYTAILPTVLSYFICQYILYVSLHHVEKNYLSNCTYVFISVGPKGLHILLSFRPGPYMCNLLLLNDTRKSRDYP